MVRHIPPKHFKMVRYFGLYAPRQTTIVLAFLLTLPRMVAQILVPLTWRARIQRDFGCDPLRCPRCGQPGMVLYSLTVLCDGQLKTFGGLPWLFKRGFLRPMEASPPPAPRPYPSLRQTSWRSVFELRRRRFLARLKVPLGVGVSVSKNAPAC